MESTHYKLNINHLNQGTTLPIQICIARVFQILILILSPEDTTETIGPKAGNPLPLIHNQENSFLSGAVKIVIWIAVSIGSGVLLGHLH